VSFTDIIYDVGDAVATITIDRPDVLNAFRAKTVEELIEAFLLAWDDTEVGVVVLTGSGDRAFCVGGDTTGLGEGGYGGSRGRELDVGLDITGLHEVIRDIPKPVIAAVNGFAIGGGRVLHVLCDLTIAVEEAQFGQVGPKVGSFDAGYGTLLLARIVGEKRAREIWYLCDRYTAQQCYDMGLVNKVVPRDHLATEERAWCDKLLARSPYALGMLKSSFNARSTDAKVIGEMAMRSLGLFYGTGESKAAKAAFKRREPADFGSYRRGGPGAPVMTTEKSTEKEVPAMGVAGHGCSHCRRRGRTQQSGRRRTVGGVSLPCGIQRSSRRRGQPRRHRW
jgi:naphthoate synthase